MSTAEIPEKIGRYEIVGELGKGAMGVVYEGRDPNINRRVAIKTARRDVLESSGLAEEMLIRFLREAQAAGALTHPNIITIYDAGEEGDMAYIAMEFIEGHDLRHEIAHRQALDVADIIDICAAVAEALAVAHDNGVIHRDVKPANIMIPNDGPIKVADFGIAHVADSNLTQDGALIGTPHYMSPEQFMGQKLDGRSDLFSLGIILYELLTGEKPFAGEALSTVMHHVIKTVPVTPDELNFAVPGPVAKVVLKTLAKKPADRYDDGRALAAALRESIKEGPDPIILGFARSTPDIDTHDDPTVLSSTGDDATVLSGETPAGVGENDPTVQPKSKPAPAPTPVPSSLDATKPSELPPFQEGGAPRADMKPASRLNIVTAAAIGALVVSGGVLSFVLGSSPPVPTDPADRATGALTTNGSAADSATPPATVEVAVQTFYGGLAEMSVYDGQTPETARATITSLKGKVHPLKRGTVRAVSPDQRDTVLAEGKIEDGGYADLRIPADTEDVLFVVHGFTDDDLPVEIDALRRGKENWDRVQMLAGLPYVEEGGEAN